MSLLKWKVSPAGYERAKQTCKNLGLFTPRNALLYIISNNSELEEKIELIFDYYVDELVTYEIENNDSAYFYDTEEGLQLSSSARKMLKIGISLFNEEKCDLFENVSGLSKEEWEIVKAAIEIRMFKD